MAPYRAYPPDVLGKTIFFRDAPRAVVHDQPLSFLLHPRAGVPASGRVSGVAVAHYFPDPGTDDDSAREHLAFHVGDRLLDFRLFAKKFCKVLLHCFSAAVVDIVFIDDVGLHVVQL